MISATTSINNELISPVRKIKAKVEFYSGSTLVETCTCSDRIKSFTVTRVGEEDKFFGFGICQRLNIKLIDLNRELTLRAGHYVKIYFGDENSLIKTFPTFRISEIHRDEKTNECSITAYDRLYPDNDHYFSALSATLVAPYTPLNFLEAVSNHLGCQGYVLRGLASEENFRITYEKGANFEGTETLRDCLNDLAEFTGTIYYIDHQDRLIFKGLSVDNPVDLGITKDLYTELKSKTNRRLTHLVVTNELGDTIELADEQSGTTQFIRDNGFFFDVPNNMEYLENLFNSVNLLSINQFNCSWRGNFLTEIGDKLEFTTKDEGTITSYLFNDTIEYDGSLEQKTEWNYASNDAETATNPMNLGEAVKQTYALVDKVNKEITLFASDINDNSSKIAQLEIQTDSINASVSSSKEYTDAAVGAMQGDIDNLTKQVQAAMTAEQVQILIQQTQNAGKVDSVTTSTGFTFNDQGLTIDKDDSEISTTITDNGMTVYKNDDAVLVADNEGVKAQDLHATTFLIIGINSRFEDYDNGRRTGCFWIGN